MLANWQIKISEISRKFIGHSNDYSTVEDSSCEKVVGKISISMSNFKNKRMIVI